MRTLEQRYIAEAGETHSRGSRHSGHRLKNRIQSEFTRQAKQISSSSVFNAESVIRRLVQAVGSAASERVLDVACGPGIVAEALAPLVREIVGIDATPEMIRLARERFEKARLTNGRFEVGLAEALPFKDAQFDQVVTRLSFHHFPDINVILSEIRRVIRPEGRLIVADVLSSDDPEESALHNSLEQLRDPTHVRMLARMELLQAIRSGSFEIISDESWKQERSFSEWAQIVVDPARIRPLRHVMRALARAGQRAGIDLREESGELRFAHTWLLVIAKAG